MRVGDSVWYCKRTGESEYAEPIEIKTALMHFTVMGKSGYLDIQEYGENINNYLTAVAQPCAKWGGIFHEGDLFYCNGARPSLSEEYYGQNANYVVDTIDYGNARIKLTLKRTAYYESN